MYIYIQLQVTVGGQNVLQSTLQYNYEKKCIGKKKVKRLYTHAPCASPFLENKKYIGEKRKKDYTHTRRTPRHSWKKKVHWEKKCKKTIHTHKPDI